MRIGNLMLAYFIIGTMMWGGGVLTFEEAGVVTGIVTDSGEVVQGNDTMAAEIDRQDSVISGLVSAFGGGLLIVWNLISILLKFMHWPIITLAQNHAPPEITVLLGGGMTLSFYLALIALVTRGS